MIELCKGIISVGVAMIVGAVFYLIGVPDEVVPIVVSVTAFSMYHATH